MPRNLHATTLRMFLAGFAILVLCGCEHQRSLLPTATPDLRCSADDECVLAIRLDVWCDCGRVYNRNQVESDPELLLLWERYDYPYRILRTRKTPPGQPPACAPCNYALGAVCSDGLCKQAETLPEMLRLCPGLDDENRQSMCYTIAAQLTLAEAGVDKALELCSLPQEQKDREGCADGLFFAVLDSGDPLEAISLCKNHLPVARHSYCVKTAAEVLAEAQPEEGVKLCQEIDVLTASDQWQQDACFHNIAMIVARIDAGRAKQLCEMVSGETNVNLADCLQTVQDVIPTQTPLPAAPVTPEASWQPDSPFPSPTPAP